MNTQDDVFLVRAAEAAEADHYMDDGEDAFLVEALELLEAQIAEELAREEEDDAVLVKSADIAELIAIFEDPRHTNQALPTVYSKPRDISLDIDELLDLEEESKERLVRVVRFS